MKRFALALLCALAAPAFAEMIAGGTVDIDTPVQGNLYVAGGHVTITAPVTGNARIAGGAVNIAGNIGGKLAVAGGTVKIDAPVAGNATVSGGVLELAGCTVRPAIDAVDLRTQAGLPVAARRMRAAQIMDAQAVAVLEQWAAAVNERVSPGRRRTVSGSSGPGR